MDGKHDKDYIVEDWKLLIENLKTRQYIDSQIA